MTISDTEGILDLEEFLQRPIFAHLATNCELGPRDSPVWFLWEEGAIWIIGHESDSFPKRIQEEPKCAIGIVDFDAGSGKVHHVGFRGHASVVPVNNERSFRLLSKYLGDDKSKWDKSRFGRNLETFGGYLFVKFIPDTVVIRNQSYNGPLAG